jgi:hypothetical protein
VYAGTEAAGVPLYVTGTTLVGVGAETGTVCDAGAALATGTLLAVPLPLCSVPAVTGEADGWNCCTKFGDICGLTEILGLMFVVIVGAAAAAGAGAGGSGIVHLQIFAGP